jgi:hypothetical protein
LLCYPAALALSEKNSSNLGKQLMKGKGFGEVHFHLPCSLFSGNPGNTLLKISGLVAELPVFLT